MWSKENQPSPRRPLHPLRLTCRARRIFKLAHLIRLKISRKIVRSMLPLSMSYEDCHENAQEEAAKMLGTCSLATEFKWHRHSCLCAVAKPRTRRMANAAASLSAKFLIANARLENPATTRKQSIGIESNRERIEVSGVARFSRHSSLGCLHCFSNRDTAIRISPNPYYYSEFEISNRDKMRVCGSDFSASAFTSPTPNSSRKLTTPHHAPILVLPPKENHHGKSRHTERRPHTHRKIYGRTLAPHRHRAWRKSRC